jgi:hypothetical protein
VPGRRLRVLALVRGGLWLHFCQLLCFGVLGWRWQLRAEVHSLLLHHCGGALLQLAPVVRALHLGRRVLRQRDVQLLGVHLLQGFVRVRVRQVAGKRGVRVLTHMHPLLYQISNNSCRWAHLQWSFFESSKR